MKIGDLIKGLDVLRTSGEMSTGISGIACDSRKVSPGDLFVALRGYDADGHRFVGDAVGSGAAAVVVQDPSALPEGIAGAAVVDSRKALALLAHRFYGHPTRRLRLIGVTGTNGKTTTCYLVESILTAAGFRPGVLGTINYRFAETAVPAGTTTPESLDLARMLAQMLDAGIDHAVMEISSHALDQHRVTGCEFDACCFTNLSRDHLDYHGDEAAYFASKRRLFTEVLPAGESKPGRFAVVNADDPRGQEILAGVSGAKLAFGLGPGGSTDLWAEGIRADIDGISGTIVTASGRFGFRSRLLGALNAGNIVAAAAICHGLGVSDEAVAQGVAALQSVPGRLERVGPASSRITVLVDYAHTPDALERAVGAAAGIAEGRLITVFGCGGDRDRGKRPLMGRAAVQGSDIVVVTSDNPRTEDPGEIINGILEGITATGAQRLDPDESIPDGDQRSYLVIPDRGQAIRAALGIATDGDLVLIAGKGHEDYQVIGTRKIHFDDREEAAAALADMEST